MQDIHRYEYDIQDIFLCTIFIGGILLQQDAKLIFKLPCAYKQNYPTTNHLLTTIFELYSPFT